MTGTSTTAQPRLKRVLGLPGLTLFGLTYLAPVTVFTTYGAVTGVTDGHLPAAYVIALVVMLFTAFSYGRMVRAFPTAGSAYTYTQQTFGGHVGFMVGWTLMLDYLFLPMINFLLIGIYLHSQFPAVPQQVFVLAALVLALVLNVLGVDSISRLSMLVVALAGILVVVFVALSVHHVSGHGAAAPFGSFVPGSAGMGAAFSGAAILALSFLGFDAVSTMSEEAKDPRRTIPRAILLTTVVGGLLFILVSWMGALVHPDPSFADPDSAGLDIMAKLGGSAFTSFFVAVYVAGAFGSAVTTQASVSRILYSMGRDGVLPRRVFGALHPRFRTPVTATAVVSAVGLVALFISLDNAVVMVNFGALIAFSVVNLSVVKHYLVDQGRRSRRDLLSYGVLPLVGFVLTLWLWTSLTGVTFAVGLCWMGAGFLYLLFLTRLFSRRPPVMSFSDAQTDGPADGAAEGRATAPAAGAAQP
ncbi:APC family permease [Peterkaempfera bronchialis]|uniref:APC family permease n=1 Tax=Peterkaempfera bronchialis TaxID=2126346 RepID=A0A345T4K9_9ACTN|nr:APC family permease [Peterkaempfera bronchialis]AXI80914.1 APC family permease [Peterkaempfera bronchialis]